MDSDRIIDQLNKIEIHDSLVESISIVDQPEKKLTIICSLYNELKADYYNLKLEFDEIIFIEFPELLHFKIDELEIYDFEYSFNRIYKCKFTFITGFGKPSLLLEFECKFIKITE